MIPDEIEQYCISHSSTQDEVARELFEYTKKNVHGSNMLIGPMEASLLSFLITFGRIKTVLEFGTFTGYSALVMAQALPVDGTVTTIDINPHTTKTAREYWDKTPYGNKITQILKPGMMAIEEIQQSFDLIFIDADKNNYSHYLNWSLNHINPKGIIVVDNTLWHGKVLKKGEDKQTDSIIAHNQTVAELKGYNKVLLPIRDGITLITKS
jgi:caffeoyl-CoA O-methyltransferase